MADQSRNVNKHREVTFYLRKSAKLTQSLTKISVLVNWVNLRWESLKGNRYGTSCCHFHDWQNITKSISLENCCFCANRSCRSFMSVYGLTLAGLQVHNMLLYHSPSQWDRGRKWDGKKPASLWIKMKAVYQRKSRRLHVHTVSWPSIISDLSTRSG